MAQKWYMKTITQLWKVKNGSNYAIAFRDSLPIVLLLAADFLNTAFALSELLSKLSAGITGSTHMQHTNHGL